MIYFHYVTNTDGTEPRIKIGKAINSSRRLQQHRASHLGSKLSIEPLCAVRGMPSDEKKTQRYFSALKWAGELEIFTPGKPLVEYVRWLRDQWYVWVPDDPQCGEPETLDVVESSRWLPNSERRKPSPSGLLAFMNYGPLNLPPRVLTADDFYTPREIIVAAREVFGGGIDCDPASHAAAQRMIQAKRFFTLNDDGLRQSWNGNVWLNPPFSQWSAWVAKLLTEWDGGRVKQICVLAATRTITAKYFTPLVKAAHAMCIIHGRRAFWGEHATPSPDDGHAVFYFGPNWKRFADAFGKLGTTYVNPKQTMYSETENQPRGVP